MSARQLHGIPEASQVSSLLDDLMPRTPPTVVTSNPAGFVIGSMPVVQFFTRVNWRNAEPAATMVAAPSRASGSWKVTEFFLAVNWTNNAVAQAPETAVAMPNPLSLDAVLSEFVWD
ncbi:MAG: hypothetical protein K2R98_06335 [Gemmataceae bacterium]|nr:hypothetical protein [Gemmataceae bacterium]